jgi:predicted helicase
VDDCADAYAQTIAYGLFLAKINDETELDRQTAAYHIPTNVIVIRQIFSSISGIALPKNVSWIVDALIDILNASEIDKILADIDFRGKKDRDPFTFFYEDFLAFYEPEKKKRLGVYYTPRPVVSFIVNSVNQILKDTFGKLRGFAEDDLVVLDPAVGTGTFLWLVFLLTLRELKNLGGLTKTKIKDHILKDFYGFELLITSYVIAHLKLTTILNRWHYEFDQQDRVQVYLTNTLNPSEMHGYSPFLRELNEESMIADFVKREKPVLVIVGNPPYSASSSNKSDWIMEKLQDYKKDLNERNIRQLDDDYVKFVRFAQWKIEQNGQGIVGFITNNSYLDGVIHKQMRKHLLQTFDRIYILNLHGDSRKKEKAPDGSKDENVFDIQQGVAIGLFVKNNRFQDKKVLYADLFGTREEKYRWLDRNTLKTIKWQDLNYSDHPDNFFVPKDFALKEEYCKFKALDEIFQDQMLAYKPIETILLSASRNLNLRPRWTCLEAINLMNM